MLHTSNHTNTYLYDMKTAESIIQEMEIHILSHYKPHIESAMKAYAKQCAEQALKDAADNATCFNDSDDYIPRYIVDKESILSTPIQTP